MDERRNFQRLNLTRSIEGRFGTRAVTIVDVSAKGAQIVFGMPLDIGARDVLRFAWRGQEIEIRSEVSRVDDDRAGLQFIERCDRLNRLISASVVELLLAQEANAEGDRAANVIAGDQTLTAASELRPEDGYMTFQLGPKGWKRRRSLLPDQPPDGFTIRANVSPEEVDLLCRTYEGGDSEARRLTRLMAELSVAHRPLRP